MTPANPPPNPNLSNTALSTILYIGHSAYPPHHHPPEIAYTSRVIIPLLLIYGMGPKVKTIENFLFRIFRATRNIRVCKHYTRIIRYEIGPRIIWSTFADGYKWFYSRWTTTIKDTWISIPTINMIVIENKRESDNRKRSKLRPESSTEWALENIKTGRAVSYPAISCGRLLLLP